MARVRDAKKNREDTTMVPAFDHEVRRAACVSRA